MKGLNKNRSKQLEDQLNEIIANKPAAEEVQPVIIKEPQDEKLKMKYINLNKLFPNKNFEEFNEAWSNEEIRQKLDINKKRIVNNNDTLINSNINDSIIKTSSNILEKGLTKFIDVENLASSINNNEAINNSINLILGDFLQDYILIQNGDNPYFTLILNLFIEIIKTIFLNKTSKQMINKLNTIEEQYKKLYQEKPKEEQPSSSTVHIVE